MANKEKIKVGDRVFWIDPAIDDYPPEERRAVLDRVFVVQSISDEDAWLLEEGASVGEEIQVLPSELVTV